MRYKISVITFLLVAGLAVACAPKGGNSSTEPNQSEIAAALLNQAKTETKEAKVAAQASQDYAYAQKAEYIDKMKQELAEIQVELDRLSAKVEKSSGAAKAEAKTQLEAVRGKWALAKKHLDQAESATESGWEDMKSGFKKSYEDLKDSFDKTRQWLSDKIEP